MPPRPCRCPMQDPPVDVPTTATFYMSELPPARGGGFTWRLEVTGKCLHLLQMGIAHGSHWCLLHAGLADLQAGRASHHYIIVVRLDGSIIYWLAYCRCHQHHHVAHPLGQLHHQRPAHLPAGTGRQPGQWPARVQHSRERLEILPVRPLLSAAPHSWLQTSAARCHFFCH